MLLTAPICCDISIDGRGQFFFGNIVHYSAQNRIMVREGVVNDSPVINIENIYRLQKDCMEKTVDGLVGRALKSILIKILLQRRFYQ